MARENNGHTVFNRPLDEGEPYFSLRGNDMLAVETICFWLMRAREEGVNAEVLESARRVLRAFTDWPHKKRPD
jgi:hypothetical protein